MKWLMDDEEELPAFDLNVEGDLANKQEIDLESDNLLASLEDDVDGEVSDAESMEEDAALPMPERPIPMQKPAIMQPPVIPPPDAMEAQAAVQPPLPPQPEGDLEQEFDRMPAMSGEDRLAQMMKQYKRLQMDASDNKRIAGFFDAGAQIGQAMAGRYSGKFDVDPNHTKHLREQADKPVKDFEQRRAMGKVNREFMDEATLRSVDSPVSDFYRAMAIKRGFDPKDVEGKSAWDLQQMSKVLGPNRMPKAPQKANFRDNVTGKDMAGVFEDGHYKDAPGGTIFADVSPFQPAYFGTDPVSGGTVKLDKLTGAAAPVRAPAPKLQAPDPKKPPQTHEEMFREINRTAPKDAAELRKAQDEFSKENADAIHAYNNVDKVIEQIDEATTNPIKAAQIGAMVSDIFEKGRKTDEDVARYIKQNGWVERLKDWTTLNADGTFNSERAANLKQSLRSMKHAVGGGLKNKIGAKSKNTHLVTSGVDEGKKKDLIYKMSDVVKVKGKDSGKVIEVPADKAEALIKSGAFLKAE